MKNKFLNILIVFALLVLPNISKGEKYLGESDKKSAQVSPKSISAGCLSSQTYSYFSANNVNTRIYTGGDMFWDFANSVAAYEIPKGSKKHSLFASALWLGGVDINGQLKVAAQRYRDKGVDFWTGPLTVDGTASIDPETCNQYDRHFPITRAEVEAHMAYVEGGMNDANYVIPESILNWPAHGDVTKNQSYYLAPFFDYNGDGTYNPSEGDYPYYDFDNDLCRSDVPTAEGNGKLVDQVIKGDETLWWVFNDKGNIHNETQSSPIGFEIRAQAFAFSTNDEINNMTFMSYEIINRSTYTLTETYFSQWIDPDLGYSHDDFIGCDVERGLGYCYNGSDFDGNGEVNSYGSQPPAVGVDFFQGPYIDPNGIDDPMYVTVLDTAGNVIGQQVIRDVNINGVNFGDGVVDNERFGMRRFVYHNNTGSGVPSYMTDPDKGVDYYNFLRGIWKDGTRMLYGGNGHQSSGAWGPETDFMFPQESDTLNWGTGGIAPSPKLWTEEGLNQPNDRRFMHSAGPFTLRPGAVNYITVGIPWARATSGGAFASVELLKLADDKAQALFNNCFKILDGPDAPDVVIQELDQELILFITNRPTSNNYKEQYEELDYSIRPDFHDYQVEYVPDSVNPQIFHQVVTVDTTYIFDQYYRFQGYKIYQVKDASVSVTDLEDADKARLIYQVDLKDGVTNLINYEFDEPTGKNVPKLKVSGSDEGIRHSFRITEDAFAINDKTLINHKQYYFLAIAYGYNNYYPYDPEGSDLDKLGQKSPYKAGRKAALGGIKSVSAIPQRPIPGDVVNSVYGDKPVITRIEGHGNGGQYVDLNEESINKIIEPPYYAEELTYLKNASPVDVFITDPLNVKPGNYSLKFKPASGTNGITNGNWVVIDDETGQEYNSERTISIANEQIISELGIGVSIGQPGNLNTPGTENVGFISGTMTYEDPTKQYLFGVPDDDGLAASLVMDFNWVRSGTLEDKDNPANNDYRFPNGDFIDPTNVYEKVVNGYWAPYKMVAYYAPDTTAFMGNVPGHSITYQTDNRWDNLPSVDVVLTPDKSKWTRCPVVETSRSSILSQGNRKFWEMRASASIDKDGNYAPANASASDDPNNPAFISPVGFGWFPGYAIDVETGTRLNLFYGEDSWLSGDNGRDMKFNPTSKIVDNLGQPVFGGKHFVYIMMCNDSLKASHRVQPPYDYGKTLLRNLFSETPAVRRATGHEISWVSIPLGDPDTWLSNEVTIKLRVNRQYQKNYGALRPSENPENDNNPYYKFSLNELAVSRNNVDLAEDLLSEIKIVPNPYLGYSNYETSNLDNRVKIINLPEKCVVSIYSMNGTLIRQISKDEPYTGLEWDLKNSANIPIASGVYLIHIKAEGIGETVLKWFATMRPTDLNAF